MNSLVTQFILSGLTLSVIIVIIRHRVGALWLRLALIDLLASMLVRRLDAIGGYLGLSLISDSVSDFVTLLTLLTISFAFLAAYHRRSYLMRAERERLADLFGQHHGRIAELEALREHDEQKYHHNWNTITTHRVGPQ